MPLRYETISDLEVGFIRLFRQFLVRVVEMGLEKIHQGCVNLEARDSLV
jgi:hypothetical protein